MTKKVSIQPEASDAAAKDIAKVRQILRAGCKEWSRADMYIVITWFKQHMIPEMEHTLMT